MKTPMQILLEKIENGDFLDHPKVIGEFIKYNLLEKERNAMCEFAENYYLSLGYNPAEEHFDRVFKTEENERD